MNVTLDYVVYIDDDVTR